MTLLKKAIRTQASQRLRVVNKDETALALAWLRGEITNLQTAKALKVSPTNVRNEMATILRAAYKQGLFHVK